MEDHIAHHQCEEGFGLLFKHSLNLFALWFKPMDLKLFPLMHMYANIG